MRQKNDLQYRRHLIFTSILNVEVCKHLPGGCALAPDQGFVKLPQ